ncbi:MAG: glycine cleavage system protein GcvH [Thermoproteota archaeon]
MSNKQYLYTKEHEWLSLKDNVGLVGITDYAQSQLGDIVTVELPEVGREVKQFESVAIVDSLKTTSDIYSPVSGRIIEVNKDLQDHPELINQEPYGGGWIFKIQLSNREELSSLMTFEQYEAYVAEERKRSTKRG